MGTTWLRRRLGVAALAAAGMACGAPAAGQTGEIEDEFAEPVQPAAQPRTRLQPGEIRVTPSAPVPTDPEVITFDQFTAPVELRTLVEFAVRMLEINVSVDPSLSGTVVFAKSVAVRRDDLLVFVNSLLEQHGFALVEGEPAGWLKVLPIDKVPVGTGLGALATTRIIATPNLKPSALKTTVDALFGAQSRAAYLDELGVVVVTGAPGHVRAVEGLIGELVRANALELIKFELKHVSAFAARTQAVDLLTDAMAQAGELGGAGRGQPAIRVGANDMTNIADRLKVDAQSNGLIFRGTAEETSLVARVLGQIDVPRQLTPARYFTGTATRGIAGVARSQGYGEVTTIGSEAAGAARGLEELGVTTPVRPVGSTLVVDAQRGYIVYYGTAEQQEGFALLVEQFKAEDDRVVVREYRLNYADAEEVAQLLQGLIENRTREGTSPLLPGGAAGGVGRQPGAPEQGPAEPESFVSDEGVFAIADTANNQVLVKAPQRLQGQFADVIRRIDLRRSQVYIDVKIVAMTDSNTVRFAVENQLINAGGSGGALQSNFGLSSAPEGGSFTDRREVATGLRGLTAALIKSEYVPLIITALAEDVDARIISSPQLLVDDNEEATLLAQDEQPVTQTTQGQVSDQTSFTGFEPAGTTLRVTPSISAGGTMRLQYEIELSNFVGDSPATGVPPQRQKRNITSNSVTIPDNTTIVVGGISVNEQTETFTHIPLLGRIPIIGRLFGDTSKADRKTLVYVFITPRVLRDPDPGDLLLLTEGPLIASGLAPELPPMRPASIELAGGGGGVMSRADAGGGR